MLRSAEQIAVTHFNDAWLQRKFLPSFFFTGSVIARLGAIPAGRGGEYLKEELEDVFQVGIPDEEAQEITTVQQNVKYLTLHIEPRLEHPPDASAPPSRMAAIRAGEWLEQWLLGSFNAMLHPKG